MALPVVVVFARAPELGSVKTRLAATLGHERALAVYRFLAERVVNAVRDTPGVEITVRCAPDHGAAAVVQWFGLPAEGQGEGDLGARMERAMEDHLSRGASGVIIVGTDAPDVDSGVIGRALTAVATHDLVFGPAVDGGYYLVGMSRPVPEVFRGIPWSTSETLAVSLSRATATGRTFTLLDPLPDIDTEEDWRDWIARSGTDDIA